MMGQNIDRELCELDRAQEKSPRHKFISKLQ